MRIEARVELYISCHTYTPYSQRVYLVSSKDKDAKRLAKEAKFATRAATTAPGEANAKVAKPKKEEEAPFVNTTPRGEKKGSYNKLLVSSYRLTQYFRSHPTFICLWLQSKRLGMTGGKSKVSSNGEIKPEGQFVCSSSVTVMSVMLLLSLYKIL